MGKTLFMFPGQGSQYVGMGKDFYEGVPESKEIFELAEKASGVDVKSICFEENDRIHITEYTQIAMLTVEAAILAAVQAKGVKADAAAGLSLGEYGALIAAGVMTAEEAFRVVRQRGIFMQEAYPTGGAMSAVLGLDGAVIEKVCGETDGIVTVANFNCPGQIVISGEEAAVLKAGEALKEQGAKRVLPLKVSGPFHSPLLEGAGEKLGVVLHDAEIETPQIPYFANLTGDYMTEETSADEIRNALVKQVSSSVRWQQSMEKALADGYTDFVEIGPGHTLSGFMKKLSREVSVINIEKLEDLEKLC